MGLRYPFEQSNSFESLLEASHRFGRTDIAHTSGVVG